MMLGHWRASNINIISVSYATPACKTPGTQLLTVTVFPVGSEALKVHLIHERIMKYNPAGATVSQYTSAEEQSIYCLTPPRKVAIYPVQLAAI